MQYTVFLILAPMTAIILLATAGVILRGPPSRLSSMLLASLVCSLGFILTNTLELVLPTVRGTLLFAKLGYPFSSFTPVFVLFFTLAFTGRDGLLAGRRRILAFLVPFTVSVLAAFEPLHGLIWSRITYIPVDGMLAMRVVTYGWFFWIGFSYSFCLLVFCGILMLRETIHGQPVYRRQSLLMVTGIAIPLILFVVYSLKLVPGLTKNFSPIAYGAAGLCFVAGIRQHRLLDLIPIGRSLLIDEIPDAMIVVDVNGRIVDVNGAAPPSSGSHRASSEPTSPDTRSLRGLSRRKLRRRPRRSSPSSYGGLCAISARAFPRSGTSGEPQSARSSSCGTSPTPACTWRRKTGSSRSSPGRPRR